MAYFYREIRSLPGYMIDSDGMVFNAKTGKMLKFRGDCYPYVRIRNKNHYVKYLYLENFGKKCWKILRKKIGGSQKGLFDRQEWILRRAMYENSVKDVQSL